MEKNVEYTIKGLKCDHCDWKDDDILFEDFPKWLNKECPVCGANVLTESDYNNTLQLVSMMDLIHTLSEKELKKLSSIIGADENSLSPEQRVFMENCNPKDRVVTTIDIHNGIKIIDIKKDEKDN